MKRLDLARLSLAGDLSGGKGRQMAALSRQCGIGLRKGSLDEEEVGIRASLTMASRFAMVSATSVT